MGTTARKSVNVSREDLHEDSVSRPFSDTEFDISTSSAELFSQVMTVRVYSRADMKRFHACDHRYDCPHLFSVPFMKLIHTSSPSLSLSLAVRHVTSREKFYSYSFSYSSLVYFLPAIVFFHRVSLFALIHTRCPRLLLGSARSLTSVLL